MTNSEKQPRISRLFSFRDRRKYGLIRRGSGAFVAAGVATTSATTDGISDAVTMMNITWLLKSCLGIVPFDGKHAIEADVFILPMNRILPVDLGLSASDSDG